MRDSPTVDDLLVACSPLTALPAAVDVASYVLLVRLDGDHPLPSSHSTLRALVRERARVLLYLARRVPLIEDSAPLFLTTARRVRHFVSSGTSVETAQVGGLMRTARSVLGDAQPAADTPAEAWELHRALRAVRARTAPPDADTAELHWHLRQLISYTAPLDAEIVRMWSWDRVDVDVIAQTLRMSEGAVRRRFHRVRSTLADQLRESGDLPPHP